MAHLSARDFDATLTDLVRLGFIPQDVDADPERRAIVAPLLGSVLSELQKGGGAQRINIEQVGAQIEQLGREYPLLIPPYFGLIIRTFSSLEGAGLRSDSDYTILDECFPYMAHRLLTDDSPRIRTALRTFLYGSNAEQLRVDRVEEVIEGFRKFSEVCTCSLGPLHRRYPLSAKSRRHYIHLSDSRLRHLDMSAHCLVVHLYSSNALAPLHLHPLLLALSAFVLA